MLEEVYTVEQFAERLKLHPKTVLRFIRDGRLRAVKVGKSYRILRTQMEAMTAVAPESFRFTRTELDAMMGEGEARSRSRVTSIVDIPDVSPDAAQRLARVLPAARMGQESHPDRMNIEVVYDPARRHLKVLIVGSPADTSTMLKVVEALTEA